MLCNKGGKMIELDLSDKTIGNKINNREIITYIVKDIEKYL